MKLTEPQVKSLLELARFGRCVKPQSAGLTVMEALERRALVVWVGQWQITDEGRAQVEHLLEPTHA